MALSSDTVWEVRPTVGSDTNGGGFTAGASGTDFSQQDNANSGGNNSSTSDVVGNGTSSIVSATASFTAAMVGNIIYLAGGSGSLAANWRQVISFTNATTVVLDTSIPAGTGITMNVGGALLTVAQGITNAEAIGSASALPVYVKATGAYTVTSAVTPNTSNNGPVVIIGYTSTRTDNGRFTWTTSTNSIALVTFTSAQNFIFRNVAFTNTAGTPGDGFTNNNVAVFGCTLINCSMNGFRYGINGDAVLVNIFYLTMDNCDVSGCTIGVNNSGNTVLLNCYIHGNSSHGYFNTLVQKPGVTFERCVFYNNGGKGVQVDAGTQMVHVNGCAFVSNTSDGLNVGGQNPGVPISVLNSIFDSNGGFGINVPSQGFGAGTIRNNAYYNNTSGTVSRPALAGLNDVTLTGSPFNNPSGDDFGLNSTAGAGAACKTAGWQGNLNGAGANLDIGPVQSAGSGGGGTVTNYIFGKNITNVIVEDY
jgi:Right handed beta helix region